ncbi:hypothetical protein [Streptomyces sp. GESEQ-4]|uniref:hypothetical protein n=1 Tax=Streptomyces sp. GESEQ-4 TaxID=2812655 RepID=UPI001B3248D6|nr:hypothetical protein [Streptomyces sp. GESEQ-4]
MAAGSVLRSRRSVSRTGAALLVLLTALVHLLACAHGPTSEAAGRADTFPATASVSCAQHSEPPRETAGRQRAPLDSHPPHCWGLDEPPVQAPRDVALTVEAVQDALPLEAVGARLMPVLRAAQPSFVEPGLSSTGQSRSSLGVWRT